MNNSLVLKISTNYFLITKKIVKSAQATLDAIGPYNDNESLMSAFNWHNNPSGTVESMDPDQNQRMGISNNVQLPTKNKDIEERIKEFALFLENNS